MARKVADCRDFPGSTCSVTIAGEEDEVVVVAMDHAVHTHGEQRGPELEQKIRQTLKDEGPPGQVPRQQPSAADQARH